MKRDRSMPRFDMKLPQRHLSHKGVMDGLGDIHQMYLAKQSHQTQGVAHVHSKAHAHAKESARTEGKRKEIS